MEQMLDIQTPTGRIYKDKAIWVGTFLGGPLAAGYFIAENFKVFGEHDRAKKTWVYALISTVIIFGGILLIPDNIKYPNQLFPLIYTGITYYLVQHFQGQSIEAHINSGGELFSWWRTIGIGIIGLAVIIIAVFAIVFLINTTASSDSKKVYGIMKNEIAYNKSNITENEVDKLANGFTKTNFFDETVKKYVYAKKANNNFEISISCNKSITNSMVALEPFVQFRNELQTFFPDNKIVFNLVVDNLDNIVKRLE